MTFQSAVTSAITRHGLPLSYTSVTTGAYNVETGTPTITRVQYTLTMYPKQLIANSFNYPNLVGKESVMFYLSASALPFTPKMNDEIVHQGNTYRVQSYQSHMANASTVMYRIIAVRG